MKRFLFSLCLFLFLGASWQVGAFDQEDLEQLERTGDCTNCDLSAADLVGTVLRWSDLAKANLS